MIIFQDISIDNLYTLYKKLLFKYVISSKYNYLKLINFFNLVFLNLILKKTIKICLLLSWIRTLQFSRRFSVHTRAARADIAAPHLPCSYLRRAGRVTRP